MQDNEKFLKHIGDNYADVELKLKMLCGRNKQKYNEDAFHEAIIRCHTAITKKGKLNDSSAYGIESYLSYCKEEGIEPAKPYSGKLNLRMSSELHSRVAAFVASTGITINDFINRAIKNELKKVAAL